MRKKETILKIVISVAVILIVAGGVLFVFKNYNSNGKNNSEPDNGSVDNSNSGSNEDGNIPRTYESLFDVANEMYENNSYLSLPKDDNGTYYMTVVEYKKRGYDTKLIASTCQDDFGIIYFDVEHKEKYEANPIYISEKCETVSGNE